MKDRSRPATAAQCEAIPAADRTESAARTRDNASSHDASPHAAAQRRLITATFGPTRQYRRAQTTTATPPGATVQRNEDSAELLTAMAKPQVFPGPDVEVQDQIVERLERKITLEAGSDQESSKLTFGINGLGGIVLHDKPDADVETLIKRSQLVELDDGAVSNRHLRLTGDDPELRAMIVRNTLKTMEQAGQLAYLRTSGLIDDEFKVVVEVHYYRQRDPNARQFHKDTLGQTLFVNLNFLNEEPIAGPEYIVNPPTSEEHDRDLEETMPLEFRKDLKVTRERLGRTDKVEIAEVMPKGVVAFVDEAVHHKSPTTEHRAATAAQVRSYLQQHFAVDFKAYLDAFEKRKASFSFWRKEIGYYLEDSRSQNTDTDNLWQKILSSTDDPHAKLDRVKLVALDPGSRLLNPDELADIGGEDHFGQASIPGLRRQLPEQDYLTSDPSRNVTTKHEGMPLLKRTMSDKLLAKQSPQPMAGRRAFFRTWVRAVRKQK
ncbi:hypothetical protein [Mitsuaria sp. 7]|uniref:hypothetical protein n=1 Tax=Mitsuaria sp. 7 TaxID=1658665 RepID=UPI0007DCEFDE|nr:hypothetical protein [Mitsuaria sp. 7]ANH67687.1 hypothetical protein ABE85_09105 [Mitsuaria sp. 7]